MLRLHHEPDRISIHFGRQHLLSYWYRPADPQAESPRPYFHPVYTLGGVMVTAARPADHVWHKGISLALPNVGTENFWGGVTWVRDRGYVQLANNGTQMHSAFLRVGPEEVAHRLHWITEGGQIWLRELRRFGISVLPSEQAWVLTFNTALTNLTEEALVIDSPTTLGRENAGYGGLFWRGPMSFVDAETHGAGMGEPAPWLGYAAQSGTLVFVDAPGNPAYPTPWFVRTTPYACACPAPFFHAPSVVEAGGGLLLRYAIVISDGQASHGEAGELAKHGFAALSTWDEP